MEVAYFYRKREKATTKWPWYATVTVRLLRRLLLCEASPEKSMTLQVPQVSATEMKPTRIPLANFRYFLATRWNHSMNIQLQRHKANGYSEMNQISYLHLIPMISVSSSSSHHTRSYVTHHCYLLLLVAAVGNALLHQTHRQMSHIASNICHTKLGACLPRSI